MEMLINHKAYTWNVYKCSGLDAGVTEKQVLVHLLPGAIFKHIEHMPIITTDYVHKVLKNCLQNFFFWGGARMFCKIGLNFEKSSY